MSASNAPVLVDRWFAGGNSLAFHPSITPAVQEACLLALDKDQQRNHPGEFRLLLRGRRYLIGERLVDPECLDERARGREGLLIRAVLLSRSPRPRQEAWYRQKLREMPLPSHAGSNAALALAAPPELDLPTPTPVSGSGGPTLAPWVPVLLALIVIGFWHHLSQLAFSPLLAAVDAGILLGFSLLGGWFHGEVLSLEQVRALEERFLDGDESVLDPQSDSVCFSVRVHQPIYEQVLTGPGFCLLVLTVREESRRRRFFRRYSRQLGRWYGRDWEEAPPEAQAVPQGPTASFNGRMPAREAVS